MPAASTKATGLAGSYAAALFDLADDAGRLDDVAQELAQLAQMIADSDDLTRLLRSPVIDRDDQGRAMQALLEKAGMGDLVQKFVGLVGRNRRLFVLPDMIAAYQALHAERRGEVNAEVVSAQALSEKQLNAVGDTLKRLTGSTVQIEQTVDPEVLGGLVVKVGSRMVDSSLRTKLQRLRLAMLGVG